MYWNNNCIGRSTRLPIYNSNKNGGIGLLYFFYMFKLVFLFVIRDFPRFTNVKCNSTILLIDATIFEEIESFEANSKAARCPAGNYIRAMNSTISSV